ncbi:hypothetical protein D9619_001215 [Psilocybe cf. subviscida]|uniref:Uncharacterized protein n=1 Tax=Psilocybe cf. subviscida TaxID=2480587 RepID=A0A8H5F303_9AGAR|nr:hypothetical protein D9619_001215 [Psilocybe cf. subviscida]
MGLVPISVEPNRESSENGSAQRMLSELPQDVFTCILDALDAQYTEDTEDFGRIWHPGRMLTLCSCTLTSRLFRAFAQPRLLAHVSFTIGDNAQERAVQILESLQDGTNTVESRSCLQGIRSFRLKFKDTLFPSSGDRWPRTDSGLSTSPVTRLLQLFLEAPELRVFALDGGERQATGGIQCRKYILSMMSKASLRALALNSTAGVPMEAIFTLENGLKSTGRLQSMNLSSVYFGQITDSRSAAAQKASTVNHLKVGKLDFGRLLQMLQMQQSSLHNHLNTPINSRQVSSLKPLFPKLRTLSILFAVSIQVASIWQLVRGFSDTLEHLQIRNFQRRVIDLGARSVVLPGIYSEHTLDKFINLTTLSLTTTIESSNTWPGWTDKSGNLRTGLYNLVPLLKMAAPRSVPQLGEVNLEFFLISKDPISNRYYFDTGADLSLETAARDPVWKLLDVFLASTLSGPLAQVIITLRPFLWDAKREEMVHMEDTQHIGIEAIASNPIRVRTTYGMDICLPELFASGTKVDTRVVPSFSNKDMLDYVKPI